MELSEFKAIIDDIEIGNSIAEKDNLLQNARVETDVFDDFFQGKYDIVTGRKGAGKTAIFKLISFLSDPMLKTRNLVILTGVNSSGEAIFNRFKDKYADFTEEDFENFWKIYFISLIYNDFINNTLYSSGMFGCEEEIKRFKSECYKAGIPEISKKQEKIQILQSAFNALGRIKKVDFNVGFNTDTPNTLFANTSFNFEEKKTNNNTLKEPIYVNEIGNLLNKILIKSGYRLWIMLDRLDEVFDRFSYVEFNGLRGLLRAYKSFDINEDEDVFRIKIFLRDDIKKFLSDDSVYKKYFNTKKDIAPLVAATHIFSRESPVLSWSEAEIEQLILSRLLTSSKLRYFLGKQGGFVDLNSEDINKKIKEDLSNSTARKEYFDIIFPDTIQKMSSAKFIYSRLKDSNGVVTPRSVIDLLSGAINFQKNKGRIDSENCNAIFSAESLKAGLEIASRNKLEKDIYNEFPKEQRYIKKLGEKGKGKLSRKELEEMYGKKWAEITKDLERMGILRFVKNSGEYMIEFLYRPALNISHKH